MIDVIKENNHKFTDIEYTKLLIEFFISWKDKLNLLNTIKATILIRKIII